MCLCRALAVFARRRVAGGRSPPRARPARARCCTGVRVCGCTGVRVYGCAGVRVVAHLRVQHLHLHAAARDAVRDRAHLLRAPDETLRAGGGEGQFHALKGGIRRSRGEFHAQKGEIRRHRRGLARLGRTSALATPSKRSAASPPAPPPPSLAIRSKSTPPAPPIARCAASAPAARATAWPIPPPGHHPTTT
eukprot:1195768-Prorocentrum_minimum.AAC.1